MTDVNNITNYNNGPIDLSEINTFNEEIERLNNKCKEAGINVQINAEHLHDPNNINLLLQNKHNEVLKQNDASVKIDVAYYDYGKSPEKVLHANILIRYKGKMFFFDTTPRFHEVHNSEADQINKKTIFQKDCSSCYVKSLKNVELFIDLIKTNPAILENTNATNNFLRLDYSELPQLEINRNVSVELQEIERTKNLFLNAPLFAIANSDILTLKNQYFDYLIKENRLLNSENRINALEDLEREDLTNIELTKFDKEEIDTRLKITNDSLRTSDIEQSKSINKFMLKQMICQQIHQTSFDEYDLTENYLIITMPSQEKRYLTVDKFLNSLARTKQLLNFVKYCQDLPKLKEQFISNTMQELYPNNPEARGLVENIAKDITVDDLINSLPATNEFQNILITFNKFCKEHNLENSYQNLLEFNKQNLKDHLQLMEIKSENKFDLEALQSLKEAAETMDLNVNFHKEKLIPVQPAQLAEPVRQTAQVPKPETKPQQSKIKTVELEAIKVLTDTEIFNNIQNDPNKISQQTIQDQVFNSPGLLTSCMNNPEILKVILSNTDFTNKILYRRDTSNREVISRELRNEFFIKAIENNNKAAITYLALNISNNAPIINKNYFTQLVFEQQKCFDILYEQIFIKKENLEYFPQNFKNQVEQKLFNEIKVNLDLINTRETQEQIFYSTNILRTCMDNPEILKVILSNTDFTNKILYRRDTSNREVISREVRNKFLIKAIENNSENAIKYLSVNVNDKAPIDTKNYFTQLVFEQPKCVELLCEKIHGYSQYFAADFVNSLLNKLDEQFDSPPASVFKNAGSEINLLLSKSRIQNIQQ